MTQKLPYVIRGCRLLNPFDPDGYGCECASHQGQELIGLQYHREHCSPSPFEPTTHAIRLTAFSLRNPANIAINYIFKKQIASLHSIADNMALAVANSAQLVSKEDQSDDETQSQKRAERRDKSDRQGVGIEIVPVTQATAAADRV